VSYEKPLTGIFRKNCAQGSTLFLGNVNISVTTTMCRTFLRHEKKKGFDLHIP